MKRNSFSTKSVLYISLLFSLGITLMFFIMYFFGKDTFMPPDSPLPPHHHRHEENFQHILFNFIGNFILLFVLFWFNQKIIYSELKRKILWIVLGSILITIIINLSVLFLRMEFFDIRIPPNRAIMGRMGSDIFLMLIVIFISQIIYLSRKKQEMELKNQELIAENVQSRYESLKNQLDPHFLFNTLSSLNSMIAIDQAKAQDYVLQLSSVFRYTLQNKEIVSLRDELKFTEDYCNLMQIRYGDNFEFIFKIDPSSLESLVVPLSIQTLVENAIKHNVISNKKVFTITIETINNKAVRVTNPVRKKLNTEEGEGIGLANLTERYRLKWGKEIMVVRKNDQFEVTIPLISPV